VLLGGQPGPHKIEGVGIGYAPPLLDPTVIDEILAVKTDDAKEMARRIAREEALFAAGRRSSPGQVPPAPHGAASVIQVSVMRASRLVGVLESPRGASDAS